MENHQGFIEASREVGKGARFDIICLRINLKQEINVKSGSDDVANI
jgi:hypothetical protein